MRTFDLTPLFRSSIGFDRLSELFEAAERNENHAYPPYNIEKLSEDVYRITMAVAGFKPEEIKLTLQKNVLTIEGRNHENETNSEVQYLYRGIANRAFNRTFNLADYLKITDATLIDGLLCINMKREIPEESKPRNIPITHSLNSSPLATASLPKEATSKVVNGK